MIERGDIRWFRFSSPDKRRPVLVLGRDDLLPALAQVPVIPLSTQIRGFGWEVVLSESDGVPAPCALKPEWIKSVERTALGPRLATLPAARWPEVRAAVVAATSRSSANRSPSCPRMSSVPRLSPGTSPQREQG